MDTVKCRKCGYEWIPRIDPQKIKCCSRCKTFNWRGAKNWQEAENKGEQNGPIRS